MASGFRNAFVVLLAMLVAGTAAACGGAAAPSRASSAAPAGAPPAATAGATSTAPAAPGAVRIGVLVPMTGSLSAAGIAVERGIKLALAAAHDQVDGRTIRVYYQDTAGSAARGLTVAKKLVELNHVNLLTGVVSTPVAYALGPYVKQVKIPLVITGDAIAEMLPLSQQTASPYVIRASMSTTSQTDPFADYIYHSGYKRVVTIMADFAAGTETAGAFDWSFIDRGGRIVQEMWPPLSTTDFSSYISQLSPAAQAIVTFLPGDGGIRFVKQARSYGVKLPIFDDSAQVVNRENLRQLKSAALGIVGDADWISSAQPQLNQPFKRAFDRAYPGDVRTANAARGYTGTQFILAALAKVHGKASSTAALLHALYTTSIDTARGPLSLNAKHDAVQDIYVFKIVRKGNGYGDQLLKTYGHVAPNWDHSYAQIAAFPWTSVQGKFVNIDKAQLDQRLK